MDRPSRALMVLISIHLLDAQSTGPNQVILTPLPMELPFSEGSEISHLIAPSTGNADTTFGTDPANLKRDDGADDVRPPTSFSSIWKIVIITNLTFALIIVVLVVIVLRRLRVRGTAPYPAGYDDDAASKHNGLFGHFRIDRRTKGYERPPAIELQETAPPSDHDSAPTTPPVRTDLQDHFMKPLPASLQSVASETFSDEPTVADPTSEYYRWNPKGFL